MRHKLLKILLASILLLLSACDANYEPVGYSGNPAYVTLSNNVTGPPGPQGAAGQNGTSLNYTGSNVTYLSGDGNFTRPFRIGYTDFGYTWSQTANFAWETKNVSALIPNGTKYVWLATFASQDHGSRPTTNGSSYASRHANTAVWFDWTEVYENATGKWVDCYAGTGAGWYILAYMP